MANKKRVTVRSERSGRAKHNDRSFIKDYADKHQDDPEWAEHIDMDRIGNNQYWQCINGIEGFENVELAYYKKHYTAAIEQTNENYRRNRHPERCKTVEDVYRNRQTQPEEVILQIGDMHTAEDIPAGQFAACINQYCKWLNQWSADHGDCMHILTMAMHLDEATPHVHIRRVWDYVDSDGNRHIGQNEALKRAGLPLPDPSKKRGRYNNLKMSFDQIARAKWQEICMEHGIEIETAPRPSRKHKQKAEYIADQMQAQIDRQQEQSKILDKEISQKKSQRAALQDDIKEKESKRYDLYADLADYEQKITDCKEQIGELEGRIHQIREMLLILNVPRLVYNLFFEFGRIVRSYIDPNQNDPTMCKSEFRRHLKETQLPDVVIETHDSEQIVLWNTAANGYEDGADLPEGSLQPELHKLRSRNKKKKQVHQAR